MSSYDVEVNPLTKIFQKHNINLSEFKNLDLLQIDAEVMMMRLYTIQL